MAPDEEGQGLSGLLPFGQPGGECCSGKFFAPGVQGHCERFRGDLGPQTFSFPALDSLRGKIFPFLLLPHMFHVEAEKRLQAFGVEGQPLLDKGLPGFPHHENNNLQHYCI